MTSPNPYPPPNNASFPALHLYPLDDSFVPKRIALGGGQRVKIARPPNTKTQPGERNGYFDSRVLSRQHAEVWEEGGKIFIKDVKSSNGTFINGERLSLEGRESDNFELKSDDILEFGVDIVSEDNKTVLHRKVVARVACVFPGKNGGGGGPPPPPHDQFATMSQAGATFNGMGAPRRPQVPMIHQGLAGLGGMGNTGPRAPGRGLTLDHIFSRLQAELAKSRDTGHDLQVLTGALNNIEDTLNGALPPTNPPQFPDGLPPVRPPPPQRAMSVPSLPQVPAVASPNPPEPPTDAIAGLQAQLREHQEALAAHVEGIRALEGVLSEQEAMKREVRELREWVGVDRHARDGKLEGVDGREETQGEGEEGDDDDSDTRSIMTATPHELDAVEEDMEGEGLEQERDAQDALDRFEDVALSSAQEDAEAEAQEREENMRRERAQTPEPSLDREDSLSPPRSPAPPSPSHPHIHPASELEALESLETSPSTTLSLTELTTRLALLTEQLESALAASSALQAQHASAQATIAGLEEKIARLEALSSPSLSSSSLSSPPSSSSSDPAQAEAEVPKEIATVVPDVTAMEAMQEELAGLRAELALERGRREKWAEGVEERVRLQLVGEREGNGANGNVGESWLVRRRRGSRSRSGSASRSRNRRGSASPAAGTGMDEEDVGMDDSMRLEQLELGDFRPSKAPVLAAVREEKSLRTGAAGPTHPQMNVQTAIGVLILGIAAAAVLWRVKPE